MLLFKVISVVIDGKETKVLHAAKANKTLVDLTYIRYVISKKGGLYIDIDGLDQGSHNSGDNTNLADILLQKL